MKIPCFDESGRYSSTAGAVHDEICHALYNIAKKYDVAIRDFGALAHAAVEDVVCSTVLNIKSEPGFGPIRESRGPVSEGMKGDNG